MTGICLLRWYVASIVYVGIGSDKGERQRHTAAGVIDSCAPPRQGASSSYTEEKRNSYRQKHQCEYFIILRMLSTCLLQKQKAGKYKKEWGTLTVFQLENEKGRAQGGALWAGRAHFRAGRAREGHILAKTNFVIVKKSQYCCHGTCTCKDSLWKIGNCTVLIRGIPLQVSIYCTNKLIYCTNKVFI